MSVYVDESKYEYKQKKYPFRKMIMCHMMADTLDELHDMAQLIGVARRHFQSESVYPHYDVCKAKRALAVKHGAIELSSRDLINKMRPIWRGQ